MKTQGRLFIVGLKTVVWNLPNFGFPIPSAPGDPCQPPGDGFLLQHTSSQLGCSTRCNTIYASVLSTGQWRTWGCPGGESKTSGMRNLITSRSVCDDHINRNDSLTFTWTVLSCRLKKEQEDMFLVFLQEKFNADQLVVDLSELQPATDYSVTLYALYDEEPSDPLTAVATTCTFSLLETTLLSISLYVLSSLL